jgi:uncharacterized protein YjbI with pentapeptide repeats
VKEQNNEILAFAVGVRALLLGIGIGTVLSRLSQSRTTKHKDDEQTLLQNAGNPGYSPAAAYVMQLYRDGRLSGENSILREKNLMGANWQGVVLPKANLAGICLQYANLRDVRLVDANLNAANLRNVDLTNAELRLASIEQTQFMQSKLNNANLNGAAATRASFFMVQARRAKMYYITLHRADLQEADLHGVQMERADLSKTLLRDTNFAEAHLNSANLRGAAMMNANLTGANLSGTRFDETTILPDAIWLRFDTDRNPIFDKYWTPETDMTRYTNPNHLDFWQPDWVKKYDWVKRNYDED